MCVCCKTYLDGTHLSWRFIKSNSLCHLLNNDLFRLTAFLVRFIEKGDLRANDEWLSINSIARVDEDTE